jgi:AcrR family transcriptional regulator
MLRTERGDVGRHTGTRERLVRTAAELFWTRGYAATGVSEIMRRAQATSGSFYHFFPTKEELLLAALDATGSMVENEILASAEAESDGSLDRILAVAQAYRKRIDGSDAVFGLPLGSLAGELGSDHTEARRRLAGLLEDLTARIATWLVEDGDRFPVTVDRRRLAELVVATLEGAAVVARAGAGPVAFDGAVEELRVHLNILGRRSGGRFDEQLRSADRASEARDWRAW